MPSIKVLLISVLLFCICVRGFAQADDNNRPVESAEKMKKRANTANNAILFSPYYCPLFPVGTLSKRFGFSNNIGLSVSYKIKNNWIIGIEGAYLFGTIVKENQILDSISTASTGQSIGQDGNLGDIPLKLSGFQFAIRVSKVFPISRRHPNSGIMVSLAPGFIQHKIQITADPSEFPQLDDTYKKGYDRLTNGPSLGAFLGYMYLERKKFLNFYGGLDFTMGFTQNRRAWNFDTMGPDNTHRIDMLIGLKVGWIIPIFTNKDSEVYY